MPTYDYQCKECGHHFEAFHRVNETIAKCPVCSGTVEKLIGGGIGLIFKGSGFYITDYKNGSDKKNGKEQQSQSKDDNETKKKKDGETKKV